MALLRRVLYLQAAVWALAGIALTALPRFVLSNVFGQVHYPEYAWVRITGVTSFALALFMVLVAQRADEVWWWSWAFVIADLPIAAVAASNAAFGLPKGSSAVLWWILTALSAAFTAGLLWGLGRAGQERPLP